MIDISTFFRQLSDVPYCIVKLPEAFPEFGPGEDIDIFCYSVDDMTGRLIAWGDQYIDEGFSIRIATLISHQHVHADFIKAGDLVVRFDLYGCLPSYSKVLIKPALFESIIENSIVKKIKKNDTFIEIKTPSAVDEMIIRYIEFIEWYNVRPDKIKHLEYISNNVEENNTKIMLDKLHHYTELPRVYQHNEVVANPLKKLFKKILKQRV
jgi:hypothetical protein